MNIRQFAFSLIVACLVSCVVLASFASGVQAALVFHSGFETGDFGEWDSFTGSPTVVDTIKKTGDYAMRCNTEAAQAYVVGSNNNRQRTFYLYIVTAPSADMVLARDSGTEAENTLYLTSSRYLKIKTTTGSTQLELNTWYRISVATDAANPSSA